MMDLRILFWLSAGLIVYSYFLYPLLLAGLVAIKRHCSFFGRNRQRTEDFQEWPKLSLIIAAYREEEVILQRLNNAALLDYPHDRLEILIGVDGDLDATGELVRSFADDRVRLLQFPERRGKSSVLNDCVEAATGEILCFSDANTFWDRDAARKLASHFIDEKVGGVCGRLILTDAIEGNNCDGVYWRYENRLKEWEGELGALLGANGAIYAIRRSLYRPIPPQTIVDDFLIGMRVHEQHKQLVYEPQAIAREETAPSITDEFRRRSRIGAGGFQSMVWLWRLLLPTYGCVSWAFWSHKVLRWFCPALMMVAFVTNGLLVDQPLYYGLFLLQAGFYLFAIGSVMTTLQGPAGKLARVPGMFLNMNLALASGFGKWLTQTQAATWKRTDRSRHEVERQTKDVSAPATDQKVEDVKEADASVSSGI